LLTHLEESVLAVHKDIHRLTVAFAGGQLPIAQLSIDGYFGNCGRVWWPSQISDALETLALSLSKILSTPFRLSISSP